MRPSPLQLDSYFVKSLYFDLNPGFDQERDIDPSVPAPDFRVSADFSQPPDSPNKYRCELKIELLKDPAKGFPYVFGVVLVGSYTLEEGLPPTNAEVLIRANAPALLYSAARELVITLTGRGAYPAYLLPSVTFAFDAAKQKGGKWRLSVKGTKRKSKSASKKASKK